jgi:hypothetical protein
MPVVVNMAHEAQPHLPGMVLVLLATLGAARYVETGKLSDAIAAGVLCGCAAGMVLSTLPVFSILLVMVLLRRDDWGNRLRVAVFCGMIGVVIYGVTNPYVVYHLLRGGGGPLASNLKNSAAFYERGNLGEGFVNVARLMLAGASPVMAVVGGLAVLALATRAFRHRRVRSPEETRRRAHGLLLAAPALLTAVQASLVAAGKPGEFGRFLLLTDVFLAIEAIVLIEWISRWRWAADNAEPPRETARPVSRKGIAFTVIGMILLISTGFAGVRYVRGFVADASGETSRLAAAREVESLRQAGGRG